MMEPVYYCVYKTCKSKFNRPYKLKAHLLCHKNEKPYLCPEENCNRGYTSQSHLNRHINQSHKEVKETHIFRCPQCMKIYANRQNLKRHIKIYHILKIPFSCDICKDEFKKKHQLSTHMYTHTGVKAFRCEECPEEFVSLCLKKRHLKYHKTYHCVNCDMAFNHWSSFQKHLKFDHVPTTVFTCDHCKKEFKKRSHLVRHMKIHYEILKKVFVCPHENCKREYSKKSNLSQHIRVKHEKILFDCTLCNSKLTSKAKLNQHMKRHSGPQHVAKPKTKATGRKERSDKGKYKVSTALKLAGITKKLSSKNLLDNTVNSCDMTLVTFATV